MVTARTGFGLFDNLVITGGTAIPEPTAAVFAAPALALLARRRRA